MQRHNVVPALLGQQRNDTRTHCVSPMYFYVCLYTACDSTRASDTHCHCHSRSLTTKTLGISI
eukprot:m.1664843 g.1664843  ORF g.1664843 m.1664843 type:complete len:63 (+) comp140267_c0_seq1:79-267(+)